MKKIIITIIAMALVVIASSFTYFKKEGTEIPTDGEQIRILNYNGHRYICYRWYETHFNHLTDSRSNYSGASIIHDPDCPCGKH